MTKKQHRSNKSNNSRGFDRRKQHTMNECDVARQKTNDPSWYTKFPALAQSSANITYGQPMGELLDLGAVSKTALPGIMKIELLPAVGISKDASSPVNNMSRLVYSYIRHANSGSRNYEAPDYMTYCLALGSAYAFYASIVRVYGIMRTYSVLNKYVAKSTIEALDFDYDDIAQNLANLRYYINYFATRINTFAVPKEMSYYDRMAFVPLRLFKDNEGDKCSFYLFDFAKLFVWDGTTESTGSSLQPIDWGIKSSKTLQDIQEIGDQIINALLINEDIGIMSGDTLKAYGSNGVRQVMAIPEDFSIVPEYNHDVLWQIHNARIPDISSVITDDKVTQKDGYLIFNPQINGYQGPTIGPSGILIDSDAEVPTYEFNLENTRLLAAMNSTQTAFDSCGTELPIRSKIYKFSEVNDEDNNITIALEGTTVSDALVDTGSFNVEGYPIDLLLVSTFKLHPIYYVEFVAEGQTLTAIPVADFNNYTKVTYSNLYNMHNAALLSLFAVPNAATAAK